MSLIETPVTSPTFAIAELWTGQDDKKVDDLDRLNDFLSVVETPEALIIKQFDGQGITGLAMNGAGDCVTFHSWPELSGYGVATYSSMQRRLLGNFVGSLITAYEPEDIGGIRPRNLRHMAARLVVPKSAVQTKTHLERAGLQIAEELGLSAFDSKGTSIRDGFVVGIGLKESHMMLASGPGLYGPGFRVCLDSLTCNQKDTSAELPEVLRRVFSTSDQMVVGRIEYPALGENSPTANLGTRVEIGRNRLLLNAKPNVVLLG